MCIVAPDACVPLHVIQRRTMIDYLRLKLEQQDWHGVADAAMDLREMDAYQRGVNHG